MKGRTGGERYLIGLSGNLVQAWDTQKEAMLEYRRQPLSDGKFGLDVSGSVQVKKGQIADFSAAAATSGYVFGRDRERIVLSRKTNPNWKLYLSPTRNGAVTSRSPSRAVIKFRNGDLALLDPSGIYRLIPQPSKAAGNSKPPTEFHLGGDFSP